MPGLEPVEGRRGADVVVSGPARPGSRPPFTGASEGLDVLVLEANAPGGQAGTSSRIENYLGFPTGISGQELAQPRLRPGGEVRRGVRRDADGACGSRCEQSSLSDRARGAASACEARTVVIATGVQYRKPDCPNLARFEGARASITRRPRSRRSSCEGGDVIVVGGGNSAGQAAVFLSAKCAGCTCSFGAGASPRACRATYPPHRGDAEHRASHTHRDRGPRGRTATSSV